jgi:hypothetical protein
MSKKWSGLFSLSVQSLEWQLKNLFLEVGGDKTIELMDTLASLPEEQRAVLINGFLETALKQARKGFSIPKTSNSQLAQIEDQIVADVTSDINRSNKLSLVSGGKEIQNISSRLIDFESAKKQRENRLPNGLN